MGTDLKRSVIQLRHGQNEPLTGQLEPYELGYVHGDAKPYLVIGGESGNINRVWSYAARGAVSIVDDSGAPATVGDSSSPIFIQNGKFSICQGSEISGTIANATRWATPVAMQVDLASEASIDVDGDEGTANLGVTGVLSIAHGGTGSATAAGAATNIINGQAITPRKITTGSSLYGSDPSSGALDLNGSSITGVRGLWFSTYANSASQGIFFPRSDNTNYDRVYAQNGKLYFKPNSGTTQYAIFHEGSKAILLKGATTDSDTIAETYDNPKITFSNGGGSQTLSLVFTDYDKYIKPASLTLCGNQGDEVFVAPYTKTNLVTVVGESWGTGTPADFDWDSKTLHAGRVYFQVVN